jgi:hypothetical protein
MVDANDEHVQGDSNVQATLIRIEEKLVWSQVKTGEMLTLLQYHHKLLVGIKSDTEKSQAILSFLATGDAIPCPKLVAMILEADVPKDKRRPRSGNSLGNTLIKQQCISSSSAKRLSKS